MKQPWIAVSLAGLVPGLVPVVAGTQDGAPDGLTRVVPAVEAEQDAAVDDSNELPLDAVYWSAVLADSDLVAREDAYQLLLERISTDPSARAWLEEIAVSDSPLELAWNARLLLREHACLETLTRRRRAPLVFRTPSISFGETEVDELFDLERRFERVFGDRGPDMGFFLGRRGQGPFVGGPLPPGVLHSSTGVQIRTGPDGVKIELRRSDGEDGAVETYAGDSLEAVLEAHPELKDELGLEVFKNLPGQMRLHRFSMRPRGGYQQGQAVERTDILGVRVEGLPADRARALDLGSGPGLLVVEVVPGTIAAALGLGAGDVLLEIAGLELTTPDHVTDGMALRVDDGAVAVRWIDAWGREREKTWSPLEEEAN